MAYSSLSDLDKSNKKILMFGGKGGVGKTTTSSATALHFALEGEKTLLISSDPTQSLSDIFETLIGSQETEIKRVKNLCALELTTEEILRRWREKFGPEIFEAISSIAPVKYEIVDYIGSSPGIEEEFMLDYILNLVRNKKYDRIIWDTAPTATTLHLLNMPLKFLDHLSAATHVYASLQSYIDKIRQNLGVKKKKRSMVEIISGWRDLSHEILNLIRDPDTTEFIAVTIPEGLGVNQTERLITEFEKYGLRIGHLIINFVVEYPECPFHRQRYTMQQHYIQDLERKYGEKIKIVILPHFPVEVKGIDKIKAVEEILFK